MMSLTLYEDGVSRSKYRKMVEVVKEGYLNYLCNMKIGIKSKYFFILGTTGFRCSIFYLLH